MYFNGFNKLSIASVSSIGVVVSESIFVPITNSANLNASLIVKSIPLSVMVNIHQDASNRPSSYKNKFIRPVKINRKSISFKLLSTIFGGIFATTVTIVKNMNTYKNAVYDFAKNIKIINKRLNISFALGSSLCIGEPVG